MPEAGDRGRTGGGRGNGFPLARVRPSGGATCHLQGAWHMQGETQEASSPPCGSALAPSPTRAGGLGTHSSRTDCWEAGQLRRPQPRTRRSSLPRLLESPPGHSRRAWSAWGLPAAAGNRRPTLLISEEGRPPIPEGRRRNPNSGGEAAGAPLKSEEPEVGEGGMRS